MLLIFPAPGFALYVGILKAPARAAASMLPTMACWSASSKPTAQIPSMPGFCCVAAENSLRPSVSCSKTEAAFDNVPHATKVCFLLASRVVNAGAEPDALLR